MKRRREITMFRVVRLVPAVGFRAASARLAFAAQRKGATDPPHVAGPGGAGAGGRRLSTTPPPRPEWMVAAEREAATAAKAKLGVGTGSAGDVMMGKLEHEMQGEKVGQTLRTEEKLRRLITKLEGSRGGDPQVFALIRKRALAARQDLVTQRDLAGMNKDSQENARIVEAAFPIPG